jgi:hypothetical protein
MSLLRAGVGRPFDAVAGGAAYTGPGDIVAFTWWGGFRAYSAATAGTAAIRVVRASDSAQTDINTLADGTLDAATLATFLTATTGKVVTVYDKVGTNHVTQGTDGNRPTVTANAIGTSYGMTFVRASNTILLSGSTITQSQPYSLVVIAQQPDNATDQGIIAIDDGGFNGAGTNYTSGANFRAYSGLSFDQAATTNTMHALQAIFDGASSVNRVDGSETTGNAGTQSLTAYSIALGAFGPGTQHSNHVIMEGGYVAGTISAGNRTSLNSNMHAAYGAW